MAQRLVDPAPRYFDDSAIPLSEGFLYTYFNLTTTPQPTYSDDALSTENENPVELSASGLAPDIFIDESYRVRLTDNAGVVLWDINNIDPAQPSPFADWLSSYPYGYRGPNIVTGSDGGYYVSVAELNVNNDTVNNPLKWQPIDFLTGSSAENARISDIAGISPANQTVLIADGTTWGGVTVAALLPTYLSGLDTSPHEDALTVTVQSGACTDSGNALLMTLSTALAKEISATWEAGDGGGLAGGLTLQTNTTYHVFVVVIAGEVDAMFDTSVVCANGVANNGVTHYRRIASVKTIGIAAIRAYTQRGNYFWWDSPAEDLDSTISGFGTSAQLIPMTVPEGIKVQAQYILTLGTLSGAPDLYALVTDPAQTATAPSSSVWSMRVFDQTADPQSFCCAFTTRTNTDGEIRVQLTGTAGNSESIFIYTLGWIDSRKP